MKQLEIKNTALQSLLTSREMSALCHEPTFALKRVY
jgi:hypothetical protein